MLISTLTRLLNSVQIVYLPLLFRNSCPSTNIISLHAYFVNNLLLIDFDYPSVARKCLGDTTRKSRIETVLKSGLHTNTIFSVIWERIHNFSWFTRNNKLLFSLREKSLKMAIEKIQFTPSPKIKFKWYHFNIHYKKNNFKVTSMVPLVFTYNTVCTELSTHKSPDLWQSIRHCTLLNP